MNIKLCRNGLLYRLYYTYGNGPKSCNDWVGLIWHLILGVGKMCVITAGVVLGVVMFTDTMFYIIVNTYFFSGPTMVLGVTLCILVVVMTILVGVGVGGEWLVKHLTPWRLIDKIKSAIVFEFN